jgi:response regulator NasT
VVVVAQTISVGTPIHRPSVGAGKSRSPRCEAKADIHRTPSETQPAGGLSGKPQIASIELLRVLIANERKDEGRPNCWSRRGSAELRGAGARCDDATESGNTLSKASEIMSSRETEHLRVLIANERRDRLALVAPIVASLGHEVIAREVEVNDVGAVTARERPDVALVGLGESSNHALMLIEKIVQEAACPVIVLLHAADPDFVKEASKRGIFAYITDAEAVDWQSSIDIVLRRFAEYHDLEGAFGRRATIERAKGILMERHFVDDSVAFEMLRDRSRTANRKLIDIASAVVDGHPLLPKQTPEPVD